MAIPKKKRKKNDFGFDMPEMDLPAFDIPSFDVGGVETDEDDLDLDLFDRFEDDDNEFTRYMRPKLYTVPSKFVRYENAKRLARDLKWDSKQPRYDCFIGGNFIFGDFIEAFLINNNCKAISMTLATLSMSQENIDSLRGLMTHGYLEELTLVISAYYYSHERRDLIPYIYEQLDIDNRFQLVVAGVHTKTCQFETLGGKKIVIHGSANLRSSSNIEQFTIEENADLYDFYKETYDILTRKYQTINKPVRSKDSWEQMEKRLRSLPTSNPQNH